MWRFLDISGNGYYFHVKDNNLIIKLGQQNIQRIYFDDINSIVVSGAQLTYSDRFMKKCLEYNIPLIICSAVYNPMGVLFPLMQKQESAMRMHWQMEATKPFKKQIWKLLIQEKLKNQSQVLKNAGQTRRSQWLAIMAVGVRSGDKENREGQGAALYFSCVFGKGFRRNQKGEDILNLCLNYGYTVLRSAVSRAVVGSGLNPSFSLHHSFKHNPFALVDDLMEPFRPLVDKVIVANKENLLNQENLTPKIKQLFTDILKGNLKYKDGEYVFPAGIAKFMNSYVQSLERKKPELNFPKII